MERQDVFRPRLNGRRPCGEQMAVCGPGVMSSSPMERIGLGCDDGYDVTAPVGTVRTDMSPYGSWMGPAMSWNGWPTGMPETPTSWRPRNRNPTSPEHGTLQGPAGRGLYEHGSRIAHHQPEQDGAGLSG